MAAILFPSILSSPKQTKPTTVIYNICQKLTQRTRLFVMIQHVTVNPHFNVNELV
jgi:hypothetical protein